MGLDEGLGECGHHPLSQRMNVQTRERPEPSHKHPSSSSVRDCQLFPTHSEQALPATRLRCTPCTSETRALSPPSPTTRNPHVAHHFDVRIFSQERVARHGLEQKRNVSALGGEDPGLTLGAARCHRQETLGTPAGPGQHESTPRGS